MGTIAGQEIIDQARIVLQDTDSDNYRWSDSELFGWLNDGQRTIVKLKPDVNTTIATVSPTAGSTEQEIPTAGFQIIDAIANAYASGTKAVITRIARRTLDEQLMTWHAATAADDVDHFAVDERFPRYYFLSPPPSSNTQIKIAYASLPNDISFDPADLSAWSAETAVSVGDTIKETDADGNAAVFSAIQAGTTVAAGSEPTWSNYSYGGVVAEATDGVIWQHKGRGLIGIGDMYSGTLLSYVLFRAYFKDADYAANEQRSMAMFEAFLQDLGLRDKRESRRDPNKQPITMTGLAKMGQ